MAGEKQQAKLILEMDERGVVSVTGPIQNKVLCLGMLQDGIGQVNDWHRMQAIAQQRQMQKVASALAKPPARA